ncbi:MAG: shikimate kinase [Alphaproteobacteria bacterium]|nr:shikimate kinase [Alphaproteobacteria bacterium]
MGRLVSALGDRFIVLVGLMGVGKSSVGRKLAGKLVLPFIDADDEIEKAAGCSISEIFRLYGEPAFRDGERRVIARILGAGPGVLATGGGAFMDPQTRAEIAEHGISIWLRADVEVLYQRTRRRDVRPLLQTGDPRATLRKLADQRYPLYAQADLTIDSDNEKPTETVNHILDELGATLPLPPQENKLNDTSH